MTVLKDTTIVFTPRAVTIDLCFTRRKVSISTSHSNLSETFTFGTSWSASDPLGSRPVIESRRVVSGKQHSEVELHSKIGAICWLVGHTKISIAKILASSRRMCNMG
jgi:hypothetical protein